MPADSLTSLDELRRRLSHPETIRQERFALLRHLAHLWNDTEKEDTAQELTLRALEHRADFGSYQEVLEAFVRRAGLFPYLREGQLGLADRLAFEAHRPPNMEGIVFHGPQAEIFWRLMDGENIVLSAPASFGKSLIIDAVIATGRYNNIVIIVPTIALIDETRRRLSRRFNAGYKIITHPSQARQARNIYVFTQERALDARIKDVDFFVIDEFYKLSPQRSDDERCMLLNQVFYRLVKTKAQFYMLGPSIRGISDASRVNLNYSAYTLSYRTVVPEVHDYTGAGDELTRLMELCRGLKDPTMIFCSSPSKTATVARRMIEAGLGTTSTRSRLAAEWTGENYHQEWHFTQALGKGIGIHHGRIPRALAQFVVRAFDNDTIKFLICTSTLIEGVNTKAKNIIILDEKINKSRIDFFTFNNIQGRSGRMGKHFVGHIYIFHPPPEEELPFVDLPVYLQDETAPESLLVQMDEEDLTPRSKQRLEPLFSEEWLDYSTLKQNAGIDPEQQINLAKELTSHYQQYARFVQWIHYPNSEQLRALCDVIWRYFNGRTLARGSVTSSQQLAYMINRLRSTPSTRELILDQLAYWGDVDKAVQRVLDFLRLWANFHFPRLLRAINNIQIDVSRRLGFKPGDFEPFAAAVQNYFLDAAIVALDEYGIPIEVARKLGSVLTPSGNLDEVLTRLKDLRLERLKLSDFEKEFVAAAQEAL
jgi:hypothetical protein